MCRLFGFRSVLHSRVHSSLVEADNALAVQSACHPHGWGVAYYVGQVPHVLRSTTAAGTDHVFARVSGVVTSQTVLAHIRKATQGAIGPLNTHPFQHGRWTFAHNGDIPELGQVRAALLEHVQPRLRPFILGETDSELLFHIFLSKLSDHHPLERRGPPLAAVAHAMRDTVAATREITDGRAGLKDALLTFLVTDGDLMLAHQGGKELHVSTHKSACPEAATCAFHARSCESASVDYDQVNHLIISSEPTQGHNVWSTLGEGDMVAVDAFMRLHRFPAPVSPSPTVA